MTGRELIIYIMENRLEDKEIFDNGKFMDFITVEEAASRLGVGPSTVATLITLNKIPYVRISNMYFLPKTVYLNTKQEV